MLSVKINGLAKYLSDNIEGSLYVDNVLVCYRGKSMNIIERQLQLFLEKGEIENGLKLYSSKTVGMYFCNKRGLYPLGVIITFIHATI